ncbi:DEAD/DEAH box helicase domain protein [Chloroherpeton thalassium ATCC 35110]|uniref:DEAD-box ATP-dependent RNA helicase RhpA n=1 Tax=Chloroherpeton thalassium (strain ATCC 35110 / GB-78) TaxID=517418 RepID=B3QTY3_CHLT3|nr:DEAD/DEAH box helicase [Chloroherpeton thalassium]ACF12781.1 DEAD/DEAH box helicase domain protein [Chloroherpeton thalassium ATCC 35110]
MSLINFESISLNPSILRALKELGYETPTAIQAAAIPEAILGKDILATAQTGTGKTAAFALPILHRLGENRSYDIRAPRALILTPTRELALQIDNNIRLYARYLRLRTGVIMGGVPAHPQIKMLRRNPDILVATPGRLIDLFDQGFIGLDQIQTFVLDEADRMLDMGFIDDIRRIESLQPRDHQTLLFSATLSPEIEALASRMLREPVRIEVAPVSSVADNITQKVLFVEQNNKRELLHNLFKENDIKRALVFTRTKQRANHVAEQLIRLGISADAIHSSKSQRARQRALMLFDRGKINVLVATDIAARGIDVDGISHVINYELPDDPENYVHRIGRTARAGASGTALSFCDADEVRMLKGIEKLTKSSIAICDNNPFHSIAVASMHKVAKAGNKPQYFQKKPRRFSNSKSKYSSKYSDRKHSSGKRSYKSA